MRIGSIRMLRHFIAASQTGNIHRAAKTQSLTQSAITKSIKQLEEGLGVPLFDRSSTGVSLTSYGHALYARAKRVEAECELIEKELSEMASGHAGRLTIGAGSVWSSMFLPTVLSDISQKSPTSQFTVVRSSGARFSEQLKSGEIDVGLGAIDNFIQDVGDLSEDFVFEQLSQITTTFFAHKGHPLRSRGAVTAQDLCDYPIAIFRQDQELNNKIAAFFALQGLRRPHQALTSDSISGVMETLKASTMTTCLPSPLGEIASSFNVHPIPFDVSPWTFNSGIIYRKSSEQYPLLQSLIKGLRNFA